MRLNEAILDVSMENSHSEFEGRLEEDLNLSEEDMFETSEAPIETKRANVGYQTMAEDVSAIQDQTNLAQKLKDRKVKKIKKATTYAGPEEQLEDQEAIAAASIRTNFIQKELLVEKNELKMPVNLQYISREDSENTLMVVLSDTKSAMRFMVGKRFKYVFEAKMAKLNTIVTVQELKKDRATKQWMVSRVFLK